MCAIAQTWGSTEADNWAICRSVRPARERNNLLNITLGLTPMISLIAGILILMMPRLLNYIVAFYLIAIGVIGLFGGGFNFR
jgi:hypothetical protein